MTSKKAPASLNIVRQFEMHVNALLRSVDEGRDVHGAKNIAESGKPFEVALRQLFQGSLPTSMEACSGYFFDNDLMLSKQIDLLLCDASEVLRLPPAPGLDQKYVPFGCVQIMGHAKTGANYLHAALKESALGIKAWQDFAAAQSAATGNYPLEPLSIVIVGRGGSKEKTRRTLARADRPRPAFVFLVEEGVLFAAKPTTLHERFDAEEALFHGIQNDLPLARVTAGGSSEESRARLLMWLFFAILHHSANRLVTNPFDSILKTMQRKFPVKFADEPAIELPSVAAI
ncbi:MAG: DUF6602 domain-containing protein [Pseudomonadota bacterium]